MNYCILKFPYHWLQENYKFKTTFGTNRIRGIELAIAPTITWKRRQCMLRERRNILRFVSVAFGFHCGCKKARCVSELVHFLKFVMNFLKGVVSICHNFQNTSQPDQINGFDRCFQVVDRCIACRHRVSYSYACEDTNFNVLSAPHGETKAENRDLSLPKCLSKLWTVYMHEFV